MVNSNYNFTNNITQFIIQAALLRNVSLFHFLSLFSYILTGAPNVFEDYFNDDVKVCMLKISISASI